MLPQASPLQDLSWYTFGTTRLGHSDLSLEQRKALALKVFRSGVWIHTSDQYGDALDVIRETLVANPEAKPKQIFKTGWESVAQVRESIVSQTERSGVGKMTVAQLCLGGQLADQFGEGAPEAFELLEIKEEGLVDGFVLEVFPWTSGNPLKALQNGHCLDIVDALIFYLNPLQRFVSDELWDQIVADEVPVIAMRTVSGGDIRELVHRDHYLADRAHAVMPTFMESEVESWPEFSMRFLAGFPFVVGTVGATGREENLEEFLRLNAKEIEPLYQDQQQVIMDLQRVWWQEMDSKAAPWTM